MGGGDLDGSYLGTPTAGAINDTAKVKRSLPFTTQGRVPGEQPEAEPELLKAEPDGKLPTAYVSSLDDLKKVSLERMAK